MSQLLEAAARLDPQRAADLTRSDGELLSKTPQHHAMLAELRDDAQRIATQTLYEAGDLTPEDLAEIDRQYHQKKVSGALRVRDDAFAAAADLQQLDAMRRVGAL